ncbi:MAG: cupin domain-containing protein [Methyloceanibacter sp.]
MKGYVRSIEKAAQQNATFRTVLYTAKNCQLVVMSLKPGEDIGEEVHQLDQLLRVEEGEGKAVLDGIQHKIKPGFAILVPAGTRHNIINSPSGPMKLYTLYAPPNHRDGVVHATKADAEVGRRAPSTGRRPNSYLPDNCSGRHSQFSLGAASLIRPPMSSWSTPPRSLHVLLQNPS